MHLNNDRKTLIVFYGNYAQRYVITEQVDVEEIISPDVIVCLQRLLADSVDYT